MRENVAARTAPYSRVGVVCSKWLDIPTRPNVEIISSLGSSRRGMLFSGLDLHKRTIAIQSVDGEGAVVRAAPVAAWRSALSAYFASLPGPHRAVVECTRMWYWLHDLLSAHGIDLLLGHAKYQAISQAKVKTDAVDATTLAQLLAGCLRSTTWLRQTALPELPRTDTSSASLLDWEVRRVSEWTSEPASYKECVTAMLWTVEAMNNPTPCGTTRCAALVSDVASLAKTNDFRLTTTSLGVLGSRA